MRDPKEKTWYLETPGQRVGPYSIQQLRSLLEEGEIQPDQRVFPSETSTESAQVVRLLEANEDPSSDLLKSLQHIREKRAHPKSDVGGASASPSDFKLVHRMGARIPGQLWLLVALSMILALGVWGTWILLKKAPQPEPAAAQAVAPVVPPPTIRTEPTHQQPAPKNVAPPPAPPPQPTTTSPDSNDEEDRRDEAMTNAPTPPPTHPQPPEGSGQKDEFGREY